MQKGNAVIKQRRHPERAARRVSGSSTHDVSQRQQPRQAWKMLNQVRHDGTNLMGFTLIELLVVVLIIGILAAVALPQYQKAVEKSRATQALTLLKSVYNAAKAYQLASGSWPTSFDELAVEIPWTGTTNGISVGAHHKQGKSDKDWSIQILNSNSEGQGVVVTRISGSYIGGSFRIYSVPGHPQYGPDTLLCVEMLGGSVATAYKFKKSQGSYCKKIMKATVVHTLADGSWNYFRMP